MSDERLEWLGDLFVRLKLREQFNITFARYLELTETDPMERAAAIQREVRPSNEPIRINRN